MLQKADGNSSAKRKTPSVVTALDFCAISNGCVVRKYFITSAIKVGSVKSPVKLTVLHQLAAHPYFEWHHHERFGIISQYHIPSAQHVCWGWTPCVLQKGRKLFCKTFSDCTNILAIDVSLPRIFRCVCFYLTILSFTLSDCTFHSSHFVNTFHLFTTLLIDLCIHSICNWHSPPFTHHHLSHMHHCCGAVSLFVPQNAQPQSDTFG